MAVTLLQQPASIVFAGNPVEYKFKSDNIKSAEGRYYQGLLYLGGLPPDPENDAINVIGRKFTIKYSGIELKFEFVANPDDSGLQLRSTAANLWAFQPILKADLESNYYISRDFIVTTAPQYGGVILTSKKKDASYNITVESTNNIGANVFYYASPDGLNANFKILCEVWTRRFNQTEPELLTPVFLELDENNEAVYDISGALTTALTADGYDRPNMKLPTFEKAERNICEYYIRYAESFGDNQQVKKTHRTLTQIALLGGFSKALIGTDFVTYITGENDTIKFLTQAPSIKTIKPAQKDFLYWSNLNDYADVDVQVTVTFSDNSIATYIADSFTDLLQYEKLVIPCGMLDLQVHLQQPNKIPVQYVLILKANGLSASPERSFLIDYQPQPYVQYYVFQNSFGGYESRYSYGKKSREYEILQDTAGRSQLGTYKLENGEVFSFGHLSQHKETVTTGYKTKFELKGWEEFFLAKEKFCLKKGLAYPVNLASKTIKEWQDGDNLTALEFELSYAYTDEFFSIDEYEDSLPSLETLVGWLPPIVNPNPENWDDRYYLKSEVYNQAQINALLSNIQNNFSALDESVQNQIAALTVALQQKAEKIHDHADLYVSAEEVQNLVLQFFLFQGEWTPDEEEEGFYTSGIFVEHDGGLYKSLMDLNFSVPGEDPAAWREIGGGLDSEDLGQGLIITAEKLTLDLESKTLVSPVISPTWELFKTDGVTPYNYDADNITSGKNIIVDKGVKANLSATFQYPAPNANQAAPTSVSGNFGSVLPAAGVPSAPYTLNAIAANLSRNVTLAKPKSGLVVSGSQVQFPTGNDTTTDSVSINFQGRGVIAYFTDAALTAAQIEGVLNTASYQTNKARTFNNVTASGGKYTYYLYDAALGNITNAIQNGALPVFGAFQFLAQVTITNAAGFAMNVIVVRSNGKDAFNNATIAFS